MQGCGGGGGGGSVVSSGSETQTGTLSGTVTLPGGADPGGALVIASKMSEDGTQPATALKPKKAGGGMLEPKSGESGSYVTVADDEGDYTFDDVAEGDYFVVATKGAYKASNVARVKPKAATVVDLALTPTGHIQGQVLLSGADANGGDLSGTLAMIKGTSYIAATDTNGYFVISQIPVATDYQLMFSRPGYEVQEYDGAVAVTAAYTTTLSTVTLVVDSDAKGSIGGVVMRPGDDNNDHEGILISVTGTQFMAITDNEGNWIIHGVPAGTYTVVFGDLGGDLGDEHISLEGVEITAGGLTEMPTMTLQPTGLEGVVTLQGGDPAVGAMVKVQELGNEGFAITSSDGNYHILGIESGTYTVAFILTGYTPKIEENVVVEQGEILELNVTLESSGTTAGTGELSGTVTIEGPPDDTPLVVVGDPDPIPMEQAAVMLLGTNFVAITDSDGNYHMKGIPAGSYEMYVDGDEDGLDTELNIPNVEIVAGQITTQNATLVDEVSPDIWGMPGIQHIEEVDVAGETVMRLHFAWAEDVSMPVVYNVYYTAADSWDQDDWENNTVLSIPQDDIGGGTGDDGPVYADITDLDPGVEYAFGVRAADVWGNEDKNDMISFAVPSGGQDIFPPQWTDDSRRGIQAAYPVKGVDGTVAVEFETANDVASPPVIYHVYYEKIDMWDEKDWSNNQVITLQENELTAGSYYSLKGLVDNLVPDTEYRFGVRVSDSATPPNQDDNTAVRQAVSAWTDVLVFKPVWDEEYVDYLAGVTEEVHDTLLTESQGDYYQYKVPDDHLNEDVLTLEDSSNSTARFYRGMINLSLVMNDGYNIIRGADDVLEEYISSLNTLEDLKNLLSLQYEEGRGDVLAVRDRLDYWLESPPLDGNPLVDYIEESLPLFSGTDLDWKLYRRRLDSFLTFIEEDFSIAGDDTDFAATVLIVSEEWDMERFVEFDSTDMDQLSAAIQDLKSFADDLESAGDLLGEVSDYYDADDLTTARGLISQGLDKLISAADFVKLALTRWDEMSVDVGALDRAVEQLTDLKLDIENNVSRSYEEKSFKPFFWLHQKPLAFRTLLTEFYTSLNKASYTFGGLFPEGLPASVLDRVQPTIVINTGVSNTDLHTYLDGQKVVFEADLSTPEANLGSALITMYKLIDENEDKISTIRDDLQDGNFTGFHSTILESDYRDQVDEMKARLRNVKEADEVDFTVVFKEYVPGDLAPFTIGPTSRVEGVMIITRDVIEQVKSTVIALGDILSGAEDRIKHLMTAGDLASFAYDLYINPNLLDFSQADSTQDHIDALRAANADFMKLKTVAEYGIDGAARMDTYRQDILDLLSQYRDTLAELKDIAVNLHSLAEEDLDISKVEWVGRFQDNIDSIDEAYQSLEEAATVTRYTEDGLETIMNLSAWFDNVPANLLTLFENYKNGTDVTFGGLYPED